MREVEQRTEQLPGVAFGFEAEKGGKRPFGDLRIFVPIRDERFDTDY